MTLVEARRSFLHMEVRFAGGGSWMLTALYANPKPNIKKNIWGQLESLKRELPWMVIGDFNCVLADEERSSKTGASTLFKEWVRGNGMVDLGYIGNQYT